MNLSIPHFFQHEDKDNWPTKVVEEIIKYLKSNFIEYLMYHIGISLFSHFFE